MLPYLPDLLKDVVSKVSNVFSALPEDDFTVGFNHGNYAQFWKDVDKEEMKNNPVVWLIMPFVEKVGNLAYAYEASGIEIAIFMRTDPAFTQQERDDQVFKPILFPVYDELLKQLSKRKEFGMPNIKDLTHKRIVHPYWGLGEPGGPSAPNTHKKFVDSIRIVELKLNVKRVCLPITN